MAKNKSDGKNKRAKREATAQATAEPTNSAGRKSASVHLDRALGKKSPQASIDFLLNAAQVIAREAGVSMSVDHVPAGTSEPASKAGKGVSKADAARHGKVEKIITAHVETRIGKGKDTKPGFFSHARSLARKGDVDALRVYHNADRKPWEKGLLADPTGARGMCVRDLIKALS